MFKKNFWSLLSVMFVGSLLSFFSCSKDDEEVDQKKETEINNGSSNDPVGNTTEKIKNRDLLGYWEFSGNIASSFCLFSDGTGYLYQISSTNYSNITWAYDTENKILAFSSGDTFIIKLLTSTMLSAEWSSVQYGRRVDTWTKNAIYTNEIDVLWEKLIKGTWKCIKGNVTKEITFIDNEFTYTYHDSSSDSSSDFTITGTYQPAEVGNYPNPNKKVIQLTSERFVEPTSQSGTTRIILNIESITGNVMRVENKWVYNKNNYSTITAINKSETALKGIFIYQE